MVSVVQIIYGSSCLSDDDDKYLIQQFIFVYICFNVGILFTLPITCYQKINYIIYGEFGNPNNSRGLIGVLCTCISNSFFTIIHNKFAYFLAILHIITQAFQIGILIKFASLYHTDSRSKVDCITKHEIDTLFGLTLTSIILYRFITSIGAVSISDVDTSDCCEICKIECKHVIQCNHSCSGHSWYEKIDNKLGGKCPSNWCFYMNLHFIYQFIGDILVFKPIIARIAFTQASRDNKLQYTNNAAPAISEAQLLLEHLSCVFGSLPIGIMGVYFVLQLNKDLGFENTLNNDAFDSVLFIVAVILCFASIVMLVICSFDQAGLDLDMNFGIYCVWFIFILGMRAFDVAARTMMIVLMWFITDSEASFIVYISITWVVALAFCASSLSGDYQGFQAIRYIGTFPFPSLDRSLIYTKACGEMADTIIVLDILYRFLITAVYWLVCTIYIGTKNVQRFIDTENPDYDRSNYEFIVNHFITWSSIWFFFEIVTDGCLFKCLIPEWESTRSIGSISYGTQRKMISRIVSQIQNIESIHTIGEWTLCGINASELNFNLHKLGGTGGGNIKGMKDKLEEYGLFNLFFIKQKWELAKTLEWYMSGVDDDTVTSKLLMLGTGFGGKTTIFKQIKRLQWMRHNGFNGMNKDAENKELGWLEDHWVDEDFSRDTITQQMIIGMANIIRHGIETQGDSIDWYINEGDDKATGKNTIDLSFCAQEIAELSTQISKLVEMREQQMKNQKEGSSTTTTNTTATATTSTTGTDGEAGENTDNDNGLTKRQVSNMLGDIMSGNSWQYSWFYNTFDIDQEGADKEWQLLGCYIRVFWKKAWIREAYKQFVNTYYVNDNCEYWFNNCANYFNKNYKLTNEDIMRASWRTCGIIDAKCDLLWPTNPLLLTTTTKTKTTPGTSSPLRSTTATPPNGRTLTGGTGGINNESNEIGIDMTTQEEMSDISKAGKYTKFKMYDVGSQRCERRKWIHMFDVEGNNNVLLYVTALNHYCEVLFEDHKIHSMWESINLFDELLNLRVFHGLQCFSSVIVFLNKKDLFVQRIKRGLKLSQLCFNDELCCAHIQPGTSTYTYQDDKEMFIYDGPEYDGTWEWDDNFDQDIENESKAAEVYAVGNVEGLNDNYNMDVYVPKGNGNDNGDGLDMDGLGREGELDTAIECGIEFIDGIFREIAKRSMNSNDFEKKYYSHVTVAINSDSIENGLNSLVRNVVTNNLEIRTFGRNVSSML